SSKTPRSLDGAQSAGGSLKVLTLRRRGSASQEVVVLSAHTITFPVRDLRLATLFYLGVLGLDLIFEAEGEVTLRAGGGCEIGLREVKGRRATLMGPSTTIEFLVDEPLDVAMKRLAGQGVSFRGEETRRGL